MCPGPNHNDERGMLQMKKFLALLLGLLMLLSVFPAAAEETAPQPVVVTIFHTNDVHGRYDSSAGMGYAMMASYVNEARKAGNVLVLDAGDTLHGTIFAGATKGESIVAVMNTIAYDAMAAGNHDFNYGLEHLKTLAGEMAFPLLSANILLAATGEPAFTPYVILESGGKRIAVVGAQNPEMVSAIHPDHVKDLTFGGVDLVEKAVQAARKEGADAVIILAHWGANDGYNPNSMDSLAQIPGVSLVIDGHSHTSLYDIKQAEEGALVTSTGEYLNALGKVTMTFAPEGGLEVVAELIPNPKRFEDHTVISAIEEQEAAQSAALDQVVGETTVELVGERAIVRTEESNWGNLATDIFLSATGADVAIMNGGNIRATVKAGPITARDVNTVFPFGNLVVLLEVSGQALKDALEVGLSLYPETNGGFPQIGGMTLTFDPAKPAGERITELLIRGEAVDLEAMYKLATNDFLAAGGDNYASLAAYPVQFYMGAMDEVIIDYLRESGPVSPEVEGRITRVE